MVFILTQSSDIHVGRDTQTSPMIHALVLSYQLSSYYELFLNYSCYYKTFIDCEFITIDTVFMFIRCFGIAMHS
jgi:hypothetical protein